MNRWIRLLSVAVLVAMLMASIGTVHKTFAQAPTATVNTGALNIRSGPGISYYVVTYVYRNTYLTLLSRNADATWAKVMTSTGAQGWVNVRYILTAYPIYSLPVEGSTGGITGVVVSSALNVRTGPGISYAQILSVPGGTVLTLLARTYDATWVKVMTSAGAQGWVNARYLSTTYPIVNLPVDGGTTPPPPTPPPTGYRTHVVQPGENLFRIGLKYGVSMYDIAALNGITNLTLIYAGQVLLIP